MRVDRLTDTNTWLEMASAMPDVHFFQLPLWSDTLCRHFRFFEPRHLLFDFGPGERFILPLIRRRFLGSLFYSLASLPLGTFGALLGDRPASPQQLEAIARYLRRDRALSLTITLSARQAMGALPGFRRQSFFTHVMMLDLPYERLERERFTKKKREAVGRARRRGVTVRREKDAATVAAFKQVLQGAMVERNWATRYSPQFVDALLDFPQADLWTAWYQGRCAAGVIGFQHNREATAWLGGMDHSLKDGQPMTLLEAEMMRGYQADGCKRLDLGASIGIASLEKHKQAFGCERVEVPVYTLRNPLFALASRIRNRGR